MPKWKKEATLWPGRAGGLQTSKPPIIKLLPLCGAAIDPAGDPAGDPNIYKKLKGRINRAEQNRSPGAWKDAGLLRNMLVAQSVTQTH